MDLIKHDTTTTIVGSIQNDMTLATGTGATLTYGRSNAGTVLRIWGTDGLGITDWDGGTYTWRYRVTTANTNYNITLVRLIRYGSNGTTEKAVKSSGAISVSCGTTGVKSNTIVWNDGTQNPAGRASDDRFAIEFTLTTSACGTQNIGVGTNLGSTNDEISTPLIIPQNFTGPITESSISVSEEIATILGAIREISETAVEEDDSVSGTHTPSGPSVINYFVSCVEFPEVVIDSLFGAKGAGAGFLRSITEDAITTDDTVSRLKHVPKTITEDAITINQTLIRVL